MKKWNLKKKVKKSLKIKKKHTIRERTKKSKFTQRHGPFFICTVCHRCLNQSKFRTLDH